MGIPLARCSENHLRKEIPNALYRNRLPHHHFAIVNDAGRLVKSCNVATSVKNFMEFVKTVPSARTIYQFIWKRAQHRFIVLGCSRNLVRISLAEGYKALLRMNVIYSIKAWYNT